MSWSWRWWHQQQQHQCLLSGGSGGGGHILDKNTMKKNTLSRITSISHLGGERTTTASLLVCEFSISHVIVISSNFPFEIKYLRNFIDTQSEGEGEGEWESKRAQLFEYTRCYNGNSNIHFIYLVCVYMCHIFI